MATKVFTNGPAFIGRMDVRAPVKALQIAITISIAAAAWKTRLAVVEPGPISIAVARTSSPMKTNVNPSSSNYRFCRYDVRYSP